LLCIVGYDYFATRYYKKTILHNLGECVEEKDGNYAYVKLDTVIQLYIIVKTIFTQFW
jgi:hypothetical protein